MRLILRSLLLDYYGAHTSLCPTYLLTGNLLSTSTLATTLLPEDRPSGTATQVVKIVDMDEMSDVDRNSEDGADLAEEPVATEAADGDEMNADEMWGNDRGAEGGLSGRGEKTGVIRDDDAIKEEDVPRWGVVLVQDDQLERELELLCRTYPI